MPSHCQSRGCLTAPHRNMYSATGTRPLRPRWRDRTPPKRHFPFLCAGCNPWKCTCDFAHKAAQFIPLRIHPPADASDWTSYNNRGCKGGIAPDAAAVWLDTHFGHEQISAKTPDYDSGASHETLLHHPLNRFARAMRRTLPIAALSLQLKNAA
jgi:hypothetical protein